MAKVSHSAILDAGVSSSKSRLSLWCPGVHVDNTNNSSASQDNNYALCPGGASRRYDMSLWLTAGMGGGAGGDWGQRVGSEYFLGALDNPHIWLHEFGHTLALDDFYDWTPTGVISFIMKAGASTVVTDFDIWMMRDWWRHLASRYVNVPVQTTTSARPPAATTTQRPVTTSPAQTTIRTTTRAVVTTPASGGSGAPLYGRMYKVLT